MWEENHRICNCEAISPVRFFSQRVVAKNDTVQYIPTEKVSEEVNRKLLARLTTGQLSTLYTDPECHNGMYSVTDGQTDRRRYDAKSRSYFVQYDWRKTMELGQTVSR